MRYFRITWLDDSGIRQLSDPIVKWTDAEMYRRAIGSHAELLAY